MHVELIRVSAVALACCLHHILQGIVHNCCPGLCVLDMLSPSADIEVPMDYSTEYDASDKSSIDDSDEACSIPGSFSPDNNQNGGSGDQK